MAESLVGGAATALIVVVTTLAVLIDGERLVALFRNALPERYRATADRAGRVFYRVVGRYFGGSVTVAVLMGVYVLAITLLFGVPLAPLAAVWAMITDLIPQVGGFLGGALLAILALAAGPATAIVVVGLYALYMNAENHFIQPAIVGSAVNLSPPTTMLAALIGGAAAGVPGALVATPVVGATKQLYFEFRGGESTMEKEKKKRKKKRRSPLAWLRRRLKAANKG
jgi:predicted PurR-regulated permease PerM